MLATGADGTMTLGGSGDRPGNWGEGRWGMGGDRAWRWAIWVAVALLALAYAPNIWDLSEIWWTDENYNHGFLIIPIAGYILYRRLVENPWDPAESIGTSPWWGWGLMAAALVVRAVTYERSYSTLENITLLPALAGLVGAIGGWPLLQRAWPAILFAGFMVPLPAGINTLIALPLQRIAATGSAILLQLTGAWVIQEGNVLWLETPFGVRPLDVALACSGLKMLMTLAAVVAATILLIPMPTWKRITLIISAVPIALVSNVARIVATGWCYYFIEGDTGRHWAHDISGWMMMPLALLLVWLELTVLGWLVPPPADVVDDRKILLPLLTPGKMKPAGHDPDAV